MNIARMEKFEQLWGLRHDLPAESLVQYRFESREGYRLPELAAHYRTHCEALDLALELAQNQKAQKNAALEIANDRREERDQLRAENEALKKELESRHPFKFAGEPSSKCMACGEEHQAPGLPCPKMRAFAQAGLREI